MKVLTSLVAAAVLAAAAPATAATLYDNAGSTGQIASPGSIDVTFDAGVGAGVATFQIDGYLSLDGDYGGPYADIFTLKVNGTDVYRAYFPLGGLGVTTVLLAPSGASQTVVNNGLFGGGSASVAVPIALLEGSNTLTFAYSGEAQGFGDEAWGLSKVTVTGAAMQPPSGAVPEPATWAMMIMGFAGMGATLRRRRAVAA